MLLVFTAAHSSARAHIHVRSGTLLVVVAQHATVYPFTAQPYLFWCTPTATQIDRRERAAACVRATCASGATRSARVGTIDCTWLKRKLKTLLQRTCSQM